MNKYNYPPDATPAQKAAIRRQGRSALRRGEPLPPVTLSAPESTPREREKKLSVATNSKPFVGRKVVSRVYQARFLDQDGTIREEYIPENLAFRLLTNQVLGIRLYTSDGVELLSDYKSWSWNQLPVTEICTSDRETDGSATRFVAAPREFKSYEDRPEDRLGFSQQRNETEVGTLSGWSDLILNSDGVE